MATLPLQQQDWHQVSQPSTPSSARVPVRGVLAPCLPGLLHLHWHYHSRHLQTACSCEALAHTVLTEPNCLL